jgi:Flp pilus assembly protein TadD
MRILASFLLSTVLLGASACAQSGGDDQHMRRGRDLFVRQKPAEAAAEFERSLARDRRQPRAAKLLGLCYHLLEDIDNAEKAFLLAAELDPKDPDPSFFLGRLYYHKNFFEKARDHLEAALRRNPRDPRAHSYLALTLEAMGDNDKALAEHEAAVKWNAKLLKPDFRPHESYGALLFKLNRLPEAEQQLLRAKEIDPSVWETRFELGKLNHRRGEFEAARRELEAALKDGSPGPEDALRIRHVLARVYFGLGRREDAAKLIGLEVPAP